MGAIRKAGMIDMQNMLAQFAMQQLGCGPVGEIRMLTKSGENSHNFFRDKITEANLHTGIYKAFHACTTKRNDVVLVTPDSHAWAGDTGTTGETLTWDAESTHMLGMAPAGLPGYNRSRFSHAGNSLAGLSMLTVSGAGNKFKNLRWMHGIGQHDHTLLTLSGSGNKFEDCSFATPTEAAQAASSDFLGVVVSGTQNHFKNCIFGTANDVDRSAANAILSLAAACGGWNIFENCVFRSRSGGGQATAYFINDACTSTVVDYTAIFLNCQFLHMGTDLAVGITKASNTSRYLYFDSRCRFSRVTDVITDASVAQIISGDNMASEGISAADFKQLLKARILVAT